MKDLILVTGAARSGVSMIGGVVHLCGAWGGRVAINSFDGRGSFENTVLRDSVVNPFMKGMRVDVAGQWPLPTTPTCIDLASRVAPSWRRRVEKIITCQGYGDQSPRPFYASARACLLWPVWHAAFPSAKWVIVRRSDEDIVEACMKTGYMSAYQTVEGWSRWVDAHKRKFAEMIDAGLDVWQIWPQQMIRGKIGELKHLIEALDLNWSEEEVEDFIAPILWKRGVFDVSE